ncbi:hypothetical protein SAMN06269250_4065 [Spirosoma fluviale]|uniref:Uncharacterized protein n=1 Tax=Spirosoma fluviale TaxID=1597977 RepID=A0A286GAR0_9BACT|nr:hypothetical protein SAMN06269250_4065 [Spirosoma fluviale]
MRLPGQQLCANGGLLIKTNKGLTLLATSGLYWLSPIHRSIANFHHFLNGGDQQQAD